MSGGRRKGPTRNPVLIFRPSEEKKRGQERNKVPAAKQTVQQYPRHFNPTVPVSHVEGLDVVW